MTSAGLLAVTYGCREVVYATCPPKGHTKSPCDRKIGNLSNARKNSPMLVENDLYTKINQVLYI